jgi:hypothetical protein
MMSHTETTGRLLSGMVLVALGGVLLLLNLGMLEVGPVRAFWPVILILMGIGHLVRPERHRGGAWLVFVGVVMLLHTLDIFRLRDSWPLFIVAVGLGFLWRSVAPVGRTCSCIGPCTCGGK